MSVCPQCNHDNYFHISREQLIEDHGLDELMKSAAELNERLSRPKDSFITCSFELRCICNYDEEYTPAFFEAKI